MLWCFFLLVAFPVARTTPCEQLKIPADVEEYNVTSFVVDDDCECVISGCVRKCCADGFGVLLKERKCSRTVAGNFSEIFDGSFFTGFMACPSYFLEPKDNEDDVFFLQPDGRLWLKNVDMYKSVKNYCVDYVDLIGFTAFVCFPMEETREMIFRQFKEISK